MKHLQQQNSEKVILATEKPYIEKYLTYNYQHIDTVTLEKIHINPTGIVHVEGYVNGDPELSFDAGIYDDHFEAALNPTGDSFPLLKREDREVKSVSEIEAEEKNK
ncbi:DUF1433 domain-containing protein [Listeria rocourtiae]|uniref:DUF1433 domain-containing protein n=1 Tax=Listeria rocourtiae TaxID=647910 RepID=UPI003D2F8FBD